MSVRATYRFARIPEWVLCHPDLNPTDVRVFGVLDRYDGKDCFPALGTVAERIHCTDRTVRTSLRNLEAVGAIVTEVRFPDGRQSSNRYRLAGDAPFPGGRKDSSAPGGKESSGGRGANSSAYPEQEDPEQEDLEQGETSSRAPAPRNHVFDALAEACGYDYAEMTQRQRKACGVAASELKRLGVEPEEIAPRAEIYRQRFKGAALTPNALVNQWAGLRPSLVPQPKKATNAGLDILRGMRKAEGR